MPDARIAARGRFGDKAKPKAVTVDSTPLRRGVYGAAPGLTAGAGAVGFAAGRKA